jgi:TonB family protein
MRRAAVPQARAALVELVTSVRAEVEALLSDPVEPELPAVVMDRPEDEAGDDGPDGSEAAPRASEPTGGEGPANVRLDVTSFPDLANRERAGAVIEVFYPDSLQEQRIGGTVGLLIRVTATGEVDQVRLRRSSGIDALDRAGLAGVQALRFRPAVREGEPVTTWVEFDVGFQPDRGEGDGIPTRPPVF